MLFLPMRPRRALTMAALTPLLCLPAAAQRPSAEEQQRTLEAAREIAIHYTAKLPDFICTEQVDRTDSTSSSNLKADRLTIQLSYFGQKEKKKLVAMNGSKTDQPMESLEGLLTGGEFGSLQLGLFDRSSAAAFHWKESSSLRQRRAAVYTYKVAHARSHYIVGYRNSNGQMVGAAAGYHGEVVLDNDTGRVLHLAAVADDFPKESGILQSSVTVDYDFVDVAGERHLLPSRSESRMERMYRKIGNVVTFVDYHKFEADSSISFKD